MKVAYTDGTVREEPDPMCEKCGKNVVKYVLHYQDGAPDYGLCQACLFEEIPAAGNGFCVSRYDPNFILPMVDMPLGVDGKE
jgi:hypothetical protein